MVATARLAAGLSGLRNRNTRVTNKTQLRVVRGNIEADPIVLDDDDDEKNRILASQGVDEEDANEHHLQAALFASSQRTLSTVQIKPQTAATDLNAFIPTPDATGLVTEYGVLYPSQRYKDPATHLRFSDSIDESCTDGLAGSFTYFLDERDADWLARNNGAVKGEGTSTSGLLTTVNGSNNPSSIYPLGVQNTLHAKSAKAKGKEPAHSLSNVTQQPSVIIGEDHFELIMGLFEKWTDETVSPYLHLAPDPEHFPDFNKYYNFLAIPLPPSTFSNFEIPSSIPTPERMVELAKAIYPWWKHRRMERKGHSIVPRLQVLILEAQEKEDKAGGSPYTCFRKRDVKPMRKTRTNNVIHTDRLTRLRAELQSSLELARMVCQREKLKRESATVAAEVWRSRETFAEYMKQVNGAAPGSVPPADELLLHDKERKSRKPKIETTASGRIILTSNRRTSHVRGVFTDSLDPHSPLILNGDTSHAFEECQMWPSARTAGIQREVERELAKTRKDDLYWEDIVDMPYHPLPSSAAEKLFKPVTIPNDLISPPSSSTSSSLAMHGMHDEAAASSGTSRVARSVRLRTGRGGRLHLDRRLHVPRPHRLLQREWAGYPPLADDSTNAHQDAERWAPRIWRPRDTGFRLGRRERLLGEEYWSHPSIYGAEDLTAGGVGRDGEMQDPTVGFEQSISGWDARDLWARPRATRDEAGWKPTPHLAMDPESLGMEVATRNAVERERIVEAWRGETTESSGTCSGGALALFTDGGTIGQTGEEMRRMNRDPVESNTRRVDARERAWRLDERWRHDSETSHGAEDRFLLDDYQAKFLRTTITLLDVQDHDSIKTDPQVLELPPLKQNRYLDHQLRSQQAGLPQLSRSAASSGSASTAPHTPHSISLQQAPRSPPPVANGRSEAEATPLPHAAMNGNTAGTRAIPHAPKANNGILVAGGARLPPDSASAMRTNTCLRTKHTVLPQSGLITNGVANHHHHGDGLLNGTFLGPPVKGYASLKTNTLDRVIATPAQKQNGVPYQMPGAVMNGVNGGERVAMNMSLGVGNLQLKLPMHPTVASGENHTESENSAVR